MIPKIIHYCWFGGNPLPKLAKKCIKSWKKYCPDYEIRRWDETTFDINSNQYVKEAYEAKKWAFVTDYVRLWAIYNYGGIYMDTDVEVIKPLDILLDCDGFTGFESNNYMVTGIMAGVKGSENYKHFIDYYENRCFVKPEGGYDLTTNTVIITYILKNMGFVQNNKLQIINSFVLYPSEYFCPKNFTTGEIKVTDELYAIHHFNASWLDVEKRKKIMEGRKRYKNRMFIKRVVGNNIYKSIIRMKTYFIRKK